MLTKQLLVLKKFSLIISTAYTITLTALSLFKVNTIVEEIPSFNDKIAHALAHFIFVILWFVVFRFKFNFKYTNASCLAALLSFSYGVLIELLQGWVTVSRQSDFKDVFANTLGIIIALLIVLILKKQILKINNSLLF